MSTVSRLALFERIETGFLQADEAIKLAESSFDSVEAAFYSAEAAVWSLLHAVNSFTDPVNSLLEFFCRALRQEDSDQNGNGWEACRAEELQVRPGAKLR